MKKKILLSFVVPFYNVEKYIEECIESLFCQDLPKDVYEVILVNDCSPDSSRDIVLKLKKTYPEIILIDHVQNKKQAGARNTGVHAATGEYIWFVDSDDYIKTNVLHNLVNHAIEYNLDVLHFDYTRVYQNGEWEEYHTQYNTDVTEGTTFFFDEHEIWWKKSVEVWRRLHKRLFLIENSLKFEEDTFYEDVTYSIEVFNFAKRVLHLPVSPYCYRLNEESITNRSLDHNKLIEYAKLSLRCLELERSKTIDLRYSPIIHSYTKYKFIEILQLIPSLNKAEQKLFYSKLRELPIYQAKTILKWYEYSALQNSKMAYICLTFQQLKKMKRLVCN